jgi:hypothetical protein
MYRPQIMLVVSDTLRPADIWQVKRVQHKPFNLPAAHPRSSICCRPVRALYSGAPATRAGPAAPARELDTRAFALWDREGLSLSEPCRPTKCLAAAAAAWTVG